MDNIIKDTRFEISAYLEEKATNGYISLQRELDINGFIVCKSDTDIVKIYSCELALILSSKELPAYNIDLNMETQINGLEYLNTYIEGYKKGEIYFEDEWRVSRDTLYGVKAEQYVKDLHSNYFHIRHSGVNEGWGYVKQQFPFLLTHKAVKEFGYYSGVVNKVEEQVKKYPELFTTFKICEHNSQFQNNEIKVVKEQKKPNDFTRSSIEDWIFEFKEKMSDEDYDNLVSALMQYFDTGIFPELSKPIKINGRVNKKLFGWALNRVFEYQGKGVQLSLLKFARQNISLYLDDEFEDSSYLKSNLYKYFTTQIK